MFWKETPVIKFWEQQRESGRRHTIAQAAVEALKKDEIDVLVTATR